MKGLGWGGCWSIARRDLHAGFRGLRLLFVCLFLGVLALAAIGSLTASITGELAARGQTLLGGDIEAAVSQREARRDEISRFRAFGAVSETVRMRAMAQRIEPQTQDSNGPAAVLTELKGVDAAYPLYGTLTIEQGRYRLLPPDRILIGRSLAERLQITPGQKLRYGEAQFTIAGIIADEPDRVGEGFTLGPVAIVSMDGLRRTGLVRPGSLYETKYRIRMPIGADVEAKRTALEKEFRSGGWEFKDRDRAAPGANRFFERMGQFLSLIGLAALVIAGIGVSNGVASYMALKRSGIATLKVLGATARDIERIYLLQVGAVAAVAISLGLVVGAMLPPSLIVAAGDILPVKPEFAIHAFPLAMSAAYGLLIAFIFTWSPLVRARTEPAAALFRSLVEDRKPQGQRSWIAVTTATIILILLTIMTAREPFFSAAVLAAVAAVLMLLFGLGWLIRNRAKRLRRPKNPLWRLAITNLHRPGAQTSALVVALGLALTLFVTLAAIQTSLATEIDRVVPKTAPNQFVLDIPATDEQRFRSIVANEAPGASLNIVPSLRGTIVAYGNQRVSDLEETPEGAWFLRGDRGVTYSKEIPEGSELVAGKWWPAAYQGPPLISLDEEAAKILQVGVGDTMTVSVLGREIEARIASLRKVNWDTMGFNYVLVFSPNTLSAAPHTLAATITMAKSEEAAVARSLLGAFPAVSVIDIDEVIGQASDILRQMSSAILAAASVAILAGIAVLVGAIAASRQTRAYD
ncbi:MAG: ABC transporter permease, partial [Sphingomonadaceae bacterium]